MTLDQLLITVLLVALLATFALERFRVEVVALVGLAVGVALGLVPPGRTFAGFANPAVVTVVEVLLIVEALRGSHLLDLLGERLRRRLTSPRRTTAALCLLGAGFSTVMNNIGAFTLTLPVAFSLARGVGLGLRALVMPLSFATLLGGLCTLVGTPANLIVSDALGRETGAGFGFLAFAPTGLAVTAAGLAVILLWSPRVLGMPDANASDTEDPPAGRIVTEAILGADTGATVEELSQRIGGTVHTVLREDRRLFPLRPASGLETGDLLLIDAEAAALRRAFAAGALAAARSRPAASDARWKAAVMPQSTLVGSRITAIEAFSARDIRVVAVTTLNPRIEGRLDDLQLGVGDILHLEGEATALGDAVEDTGLMQLTPTAELESRHFIPTAIAAFALGVLAAAFGLAPPEIAFGAVVVVLAASGALDLRVALAELNWPIVLLLGAMLPLGEALATTGAAATFAAGLHAAVPSTSPLATCALMLGLAMLVTPFVNNATTAVILAPVAVELSRSAGVSPALLLMAVAIGASSDFLTPFGHHNNTLAYGLGGYRFGDFLRTGWPVSLAALLTGVASCLLVWA